MSAQKKKKHKQVKPAKVSAAAARAAEPVKEAVKTVRKELAEKIRVSIIVPVYNVAPFLRECMDSLINQTLQEIEILCFDDCSDDGSGQILDEYARKDGRVKVVHYEENKTAAQARKDGALMATGEYIMYVDGDDGLEPESCERLAKLMDEKRVDMIHFGTKVIAEEGVPESRYAAMEQMLRPCNGKIQGALLKKCFVENRFRFQIWNKIYSAKLVKQAMNLFPDGRFSKAQDLFAFYLICYFAQSYFGIPEESYYRYCFGRGVTGHERISRATIKRYAEHALIVQGITDFLKKLNRLEVEQASLAAVEDRLLNDSMAQLYNGHVAPEDMNYALETMCEYWGVPTVIGNVVEKQRFKRTQWAQKLLDCEVMYPAPRKTKRIGTFYHSINNGGAQRVVTSLATQWVNLGYEVVLFTDNAASPDDYPIPDSVQRVVLPAFDAGDMVSCKERARVLYESVKELGIDVMVHQAWASPSMLFDLMSVKLAGALFYIHAHNIFSMPLLSSSITNRFFEMQDVYALADGIMTLSETDTCYWKMINPRVFTVVNPLTFDLDGCQTNSLDGKTILWLGRISNEKYPLQGIEIFDRVHARHPDAKMLVVGKGSPQLEELMAKMVEDKGLTDSVELCGFHTDVEPFYQKADIFLCTSKYEGFCLTIQEAQSHGVPCVVYDMPYLTLLEDSKGSFGVPMCDKDAAAEKICMLLEDREMLKAAGRDARANVLEKCLIDFDKLWIEIFSSTEQPREPLQESYERRMLKTLSEHMRMYVAENAKKKGSVQGIDHYNMALAAPMPTRGPLKTLRRKAHTAFRVLALDGWSGVKKIMNENKAAK